MIMKISEIILVLLKALINICLMSMKSLEISGNVDADGVPVDDDYQKLGFFLSSFCDTLKQYEDETKDI